MKEPNYDLILKGKLDYYGETRAAYEFAANEFADQKIKYVKMFGDSGLLLEKYVEHVFQYTGSNFINEIHKYNDDIHFTDEEIKILRVITDK